MPRGAALEGAVHAAEALDDILLAIAGSSQQRIVTLSLVVIPAK
jgi:hypothetical protein